MLSTNNFKDVIGVKEDFDKVKFLNDLKSIEKYASQHMKNSQLSEGLNMFVEQYGRISVYERHHKMIIAGALKGVTRTIETFLFDKQLTAEDKDVKNLVSELKDIMVNIEHELELEAKLKAQREAQREARLK